MAITTPKGLIPVQGESLSFVFKPSDPRVPECTARELATVRRYLRTKHPGLQFETVPMGAGLKIYTKTDQVIYFSEYIIVEI